MVETRTSGGGSAGVGDLFREDYEKTSIVLPADNYDLSGNGPLRGPTFDAPPPGGGGGGAERYADYVNETRKTVWSSSISRHFISFHFHSRHT